MATFGQSPAGIGGRAQSCGRATFAPRGAAVTKARDEFS